MRILTFILALSVFYMSAMTCADETCSVVSAQESSTGATHSHDHSSDEDDDCTPFCTCDCCGVSITVPQVFKFEVEDISLEHQDIYSNFYSLDYSYSHNTCIWHPPSNS